MACVFLSNAIRVALGYQQAVGQLYPKKTSHAICWFECGCHSTLTAYILPIASYLLSPSSFSPPPIISAGKSCLPSPSPQFLSTYCYTAYTTTMQTRCVQVLVSFTNTVSGISWCSLGHRLLLCLQFYYFFFFNLTMSLDIGCCKRDWLIDATSFLGGHCTKSRSVLVSSHVYELVYKSRCTVTQPGPCAHCLSSLCHCYTEDTLRMYG